ncbi:MAG: lasso peptide biosynthesis B2 protein [Chloroflexi bacterium]|nr:lasso peptide biosynthesis B2 protein [Chloroflexota bacterium]
MSQRLARFRRFPAHRRPYLLEAMFYLLAARLALRVIPFRRLTRVFERPPRRPKATWAERERLRSDWPTPYTVHRDEITGAERERLLKGTAWLIDQAAWFLPCQMACFPRSIAAQVFLRRLGIGVTLCYGAATLPERGLTAHVWLQDGSEVVVGHDVVRDYHVLAYYPDRASLDGEPGGRSTVAGAGSRET